MVSDERKKIKLLWVKTPKCGGTSFVHTIRNQLVFDPDTIPEDLTNSTKKIYTLKNNDEIGIITHGSVIKFRKNYPDFYSASYKFAMIRNPYERIISSYYFLIQKKWYSGSFKEFIKIPFEDMSPSVRLHTQPLTFHLSDENKLGGIDYLDKLIPTENLEENINNLFKKFKMPTIKMPHVNKTKHQHYTKYYTNETKKIIEEKYAKDIECFGYEF